MRRAFGLPPSARNLYFPMPNYYSEPKETYKDTEDTEERLKKRVNRRENKHDQLQTCAA
jgi:hypothetical protein